MPLPYRRPPLLFGIGQTGTETARARNQASSSPKLAVLAPEASQLPICSQLLVILLLTHTLELSPCPLPFSPCDSDASRFSNKDNHHSSSSSSCSCSVLLLLGPAPAQRSPISSIPTPRVYSLSSSSFSNITPHLTLPTNPPLPFVLPHHNNFCLTLLATSIPFFHLPRSFIKLTSSRFSDSTLPSQPAPRVPSTYVG